MFKSLHEEVKHAYGSRRIHQELRAHGHRSVKSERVHGTSYTTREQAKAEVFESVEIFSNHTRRHSSLGCLSLEAFLAHWMEAHTMLPRQAA